ncbi:MAG: hypothetical protein CM1200mP10_05870 [Candidatus Neomarinimicrobiota bacterium]|nr:MAG: hypothetical protein CM1200mP10_05870 [Candidatus Neomarinimicrobiota bacterium]
MTGRDPLKIYGERFQNNSDNVSYGLDYADRLLNAKRARRCNRCFKTGHFSR